MCSLLFTVTPDSSGVMLAASLFSIWDTLWPYLMMVLGFSLIVFVHELGHFAVAKWCDVRVERFAVGFGRELFGFTRGETRYSFNALPFGGYVKMLGQEDFDDKANELKFNNDPRSFVNKSVGRRMAIVSAGVVMNVLFAGLLFMIVFLAGMEAISPRIAMVEPDSPAERGGLLPGDLIRSINGEPVYEFNEVQAAVLLAEPHEDIEFVVKRSDGEHVVHVEPESRRPKHTKDVRRQVVGISPGVTNEIVAVGPEIDESRADMPRPGDKIVEAVRVAVTAANTSELYNVMAFLGEEALVERPDPKNPQAPPTRVPVRIPPVLSLFPSDPSDPSTISVLGLTPLVRIGSVDPRGRAYLAGIQVGDTVLSWDDLPHPTQFDILTAVRDSAERDIPFRVRKSDGREIQGFVRPKLNSKGSQTIQSTCEAMEVQVPEASERSAEAETSSVSTKPRARFSSVRHRGAAHTAGLRPGDVVEEFFGNANPTCLGIERVVRSNSDRLLPFTVRRADGSTYRGAVRPQPPGSMDATFGLVADDLLRTGEILPRIEGRPSPAAEAGIPAGATIRAVADEKVSTWRELIAALQRAAGGSVELSYSGPDGVDAVSTLRVPHCLRTKLGVGPGGRIVRIDGREAVTVQKGATSERLSVRYHEGTRAILRELVGRTGVTVEYRENPLAELKTAQVDITEDMVDPWLGRVSLSPNILLADETILLRSSNPIEAISIGVHKTWYFIRQVYLTMKRMFFTRSVGLENVSGPLGIFDMGGKIARAGWEKFLFFLAIISANLAVINFLPLPIVDGGLMVFLLIEKIKGSPVSLRIQVATQMLGIVLIGGAFLFVTYQDILRMFG